MKCPKCKTFNPPKSTECDGCGVQFADIRSSGSREVNRTCPWNDHGHACGTVGSLSESTTGSGPWYCSTHYWKLKGYAPATPRSEAAITLRQRWYREAGIEYNPPKMFDQPPFRCVGTLSPVRMPSMREPCQEG